MNCSEYILAAVLVKAWMRHPWLYAACLLSALLHVSCINTDISDCAKFALTVQAKDANGEDITATGEAGDVRLFVFDNNLYYVDEMLVPADKVKHGESLPLNYPDLNGSLWVVAWSNDKGNQSVLPNIFTRTTHIADALVQMKRGTDGYAIEPDDLFYGFTEVCSQCSDNVVVIERKTAQISISARGVPDEIQGTDFSFVVRGAQEDTYDFLGNLVGTPIAYRQLGALIPARAGALVTIAPFRVYPLSEGNRLQVDVYKGETLIASANKDDEGREIRPQPGLTTNILFKFNEEPSTIDLKIVVTDWNNYYEWLEY